MSAPCRRRNIEAQAPLLHIDALGWERFFYACFACALPGMLLLFKVAPWSGQSTCER